MSALLRRCASNYLKEGWLATGLLRIFQKFQAQALCFLSFCLFRVFAGSIGEI